MASTETIDVVGTGARSPFTFGIGRGVRSVSIAEGLDKINQSIRTILMTRPGERVMMPTFGSRLYDLVFEASDVITNQLLYLYTVEALHKWEPRIKVTNVSFESDNDRQTISIRIEYLVLQTHQEGSYVFPYERGPQPMSTAVDDSEQRRIFTAGTVLPPDSATGYGFPTR